MHIKNSVSVIGAMLCCLAVIGFNINSQAAPLAPSVSSITTSADPAVKDDNISVRPAATQNNGSAVIALSWVYLPKISSPSWTTAANSLITDAEAGKLNTATTVSSPTQYAVVATNHLVSWTNLVLSTPTPLWGGLLNPPAPFNVELGGPSVWILIDAWSSSGGDTISLDQLSVTSVSAPDGNNLGTNTTFTGLSYTPRAIAIKSDGTVITSGSTSQKGKRVLVLVQNKLFSADTQLGLNTVQNWINYYSPYTWKYAVQVIGDNNTLSSTTVSTAAINVPVPVISITATSGTTASVSVSNGISGAEYQIWATKFVAPGSWQLVSVLNSNNSLSVSTSTGSMFYRASVQ